MKQMVLSRRGVLVRLPKRSVCCFCREYIMPGQAYRFANIDPHRVTITYLHGHVTCADKRGKRVARGSKAELPTSRFWSSGKVWRC